MYGWLHIHIVEVVKKEEKELLQVTAIHTTSGSHYFK